MAKITQKDKVDIIKAYEQLETVISLAQKHNVTRQAIYKVLRQHGIDTSKKQLQVSCRACGELLTRNKARVRKQKNHFCNYECYFAFLEAGNDNIYIQNRQGQRIGRRIVSCFFELSDTHIVHHEDRNTLNNLPYNLKVFACQGDHIRYHRGFEIDPIWDGSKLPTDVGSKLPY
jgi:hypothetical protein